MRRPTTGAVARARLATTLLALLAGSAVATAVRAVEFDPASVADGAEAGRRAASESVKTDAACLETVEGDLVLRASRRCSGARLQEQLRSQLQLVFGVPAAAVPTPAARTPSGSPPAPVGAAHEARAATAGRAPARPAAEPVVAATPASAMPASATPVSAAALVSAGTVGSVGTPPAARRGAIAPPVPWRSAYRPTAPAHRAAGSPASQAPPAASANATAATTATGATAAATATAPAAAAVDSRAAAQAELARASRVTGDHPLNRIQQMRSIESGWRSSSSGRAP